MATLPNGYHFVERNALAVEDVMALRESVGWGDDDRQRWNDCFEQSLCIVGVATESNQLVGVGFVAGNARHAVFCDLCVHPKHRGRGLALSLFQWRLDWIRRHGIPYLYTSLSAQNPLRRAYDEAGFFIAIE